MIELPEAIIVALISSAVTLTGVLIANAKSQAVMETKIEHLTEEVRRHNDFANRIPSMEAKIDLFEKDLERLEKEVMEK